MFFVGATALFGALAVSLPAQTPRPAAHFVAGNNPDQAEGRRALEEFRAAGLSGDYWLELDLRVMPHHGDEHASHGQIIGTRGEHGPLTRLDLADQRWLIESGPRPAMWTAVAGGLPRKLTEAESFQPLPGTDLAPFDLQMPFLYWDDFVYEGLAKIRGRPAYSFLLYPPADLAAQRPDLAGVRVALDSQFHALVQAELIGPNGQAQKIISVLDLKKADGQWMVKTVDVRNLVTRDKTRLEITAAALNLTLSPGLFTGDALVQMPFRPDPAKVERF